MNRFAIEIVHPMEILLQLWRGLQKMGAFCVVFVTAMKAVVVAVEVV